MSKLNIIIFPRFIPSSFRKEDHEL
jgi:hypothetical protein